MSRKAKTSFAVASNLLPPSDKRRLFSHGNGTADIHSFETLLVVETRPIYRAGMIHRAVNQQRLYQRGARFLFSLLTQGFPDESHTAGDSGVAMLVPDRKSQSSSPERP